MTKVLAQGTFDLLHPGHLHYLREAKAMGEQLHVIVARGENVTHKQPPVLPDQQRLEMVAALNPVDAAHIGHPEDIFVPVERIDPDVLVLGYDQHHDEEKIADALTDRGIDCAVRRANACDTEYDGAVLSTGEIIDRILQNRDGE
ncbi:FAD synthase [Halorhabdus sp. CBA1104]|uniref:adenylyltransferase/cytidyltransferase family protein n=1 Tax=Halorhabdus sp. CBA1104 TaxID=1380432 RepID=UPI0012B381CB|nr:adenylyltransferase/cytidyltransferase family protein [Halorhabdus sp. CBA1104]QGN07503.1 FAD synthase [Halorhabdus sp. CBA1104]